ncbi:MAG: phenylalanine--tRNA ligase subunit alpha [Bacteroidota bacterium]
MKKKITTLTEAVKAYQGSIEAFKNRFTGRKGALAGLFKSLKSVSAEEKQKVGKELNALKKLISNKLEELTKVEGASALSTRSVVDPTLPPRSGTLGSLHPLRVMERKIVEIFKKIGFVVAEGNEIEHDFYNFSALNFPKDHPARDMQDTFFLDEKKEWLLRTHTSPVQIRMMSKGQPPFRMVAPGRVYRNEAISARTHCMFHQVEAFYVDKEVTIADLKGVLLHFIQSLFGSEQTMRLRPSFFPFTEPSVEVDMSCVFCAQKGCNICKKSGWVEILGAGMIDPNVFKACEIDPTRYRGFALGMGIERISMLYYQIEDVRLFTENDVRFLRQFATFH